jgi:hypothetical protein
MYWKLRHNATRQSYDEMPRGQQPTPEDIKTWKRTQAAATRISGLKPVLYDCCVNSCCAFTGPKSSLEACPYCNADRFDASRKPRKRFSYVPLIPRLVALMANEEKAKEARYRGEVHKHDPAMLQDIFDGKLYRSLLNKRVSIGGRLQRHTFFQDTRDMALGFSTDGYAPFRKRSKTAWPLLLYNYNLPPEVRFHLENILCVGVIPGPKKPHDFDSFIWPLVQELVQLEAGVAAVDAVSKERFKLRAYLLVVFGDMPAVAMVMHMTGTNGVCPCRFCKILGVRIPGRDRPYYVPLDRSRHPSAQGPDAIKSYDPENLPLRSHAQFLAEAQAAETAPGPTAHERLAKANGIKGTPLLACLAAIHFPWSFPYDFMHLVWENVAKNLFSLWSGTFTGVGFDFSTEPWVLSKEELAEVGKIGEQSGSKIPYVFGPRPPNITSDKVSWTAETRAFYTMHVAPSAFRDRQRDDYFFHFIQLVKLLGTCVDFEIPRDQLPILRSGFASWVKEFERYAVLLAVNLRMLILSLACITVMIPRVFHSASR